uniref:Uncharacterized protein n=1 Tax=Picea glauca TaxID=3330 RepID=A0A101LVW5_PICGL|nr:hypothetical protein ABT39_MTgene1820 [Picea glauca]QHR91825.1 hypothetical protein Q903MT_gene5861 [Picea sitchensis]
MVPRYAYALLFPPTTSAKLLSLLLFIFYSQTLLPLLLIRTCRCTPLRKWNPSATYVAIEVYTSAPDLLGFFGRTDLVGVVLSSAPGTQRKASIDSLPFHLCPTN